MFLVGTEALDQLGFECGVPVGKAVGICNLGTVELEACAIRGQLHQLEADRGLLIIAVDAKLFDGPVAPFAQVGGGDDVAAVAVAADQDAVVAVAAAVKGK